MAKARAFWITGRGQGEIREVELTSPQAGQAMVLARFGAISRGTELLVYNGAVPETQHTRMRAPHQEGDFPWPVKYGYCNVGRVVEGSEDLEGRDVFCLYPHQSRYVVPERDLIPLPDGLPAQRAVLAANMETALNGLWDAQLRAGDRVTVIGAGTLGCLTAHLAARHPGTSVQLVDLNDARSTVAEALGVTYASPAQATPEADLVIHASGSATGLQTALELAADEARILELSWYGETRVQLTLGEAFHSRRLSIVSSQVGQLPPSQRPRWDHRRRLELALTLLMDERLDVLITDESPFEQLPRVMKTLAAGAPDTLCHRINYE